MFKHCLYLLLVLSLSVPVSAQQQQQGNEPADNSAADQQKLTPEQESEKKQQDISKIQAFLKPFIFSGKSLRDPFEPQRLSAPLRPGEVYGPFLTTQMYRLGDYKLKGLLWQTSEPVAIFTDPKGYTHRLKVKDYIGENFGYIATIREKEVVVIQTIEENNRRYSTTKVVFLQ